MSRDFNETIDSQGNVYSYQKNPQGTYDSNPSPTNNNSHGTEVAGIAAAVGNNGIGISGVAPNAAVAGLRLTAGEVNDKQIADAVSYLRNDIDIYNSSWKIIDNFWASPMAEYELEIGATQGRNGLGNIHVFAAGNDGGSEGNVNYNTLTNSRHGIVVGAVTSSGEETNYSQPGAAVLVSAYAGGIATTDLLGNQGVNPGNSFGDYLDGNYTGNGSATSVPAAQVSGTVALMLEANPSLSLRDVQHILVETAVKNNPTNQGWVTNGGGNNVHNQYGFGVVDAAAAVSLAKNWTSVGSEVKISAFEEFDNPILIPDNDENGITRKFTISEDITVESAEVLFDAKHDFRGDLEVILTSPDGTESVLASHNGIKGKDFDKWVFTSVRNWGESAVGEWKLSVKDWQSGDVGSLSEWGLNIYGSKPTVTIKATDDFAAEGEDAGEFTVFRSGSSKNQLTVSYEIDLSPVGTKPPATNGVDYEKLTGTITIPAGADSVKIPIITLDDSDAELPEIVKLKLKENNGYQVGNSNVDWLLIADTETPQISVYAGAYY
ncbi:S8 family serine peptidase [Limnofasciculus baicalensis]|uniref:S8 family serine peptidase n=1 Tax=Limnofasciculus baicalensis BBK-W-15 TaxID=2699891 RepID=A0AAE3KRJ9_9CYAN|nr:S8 family serine peptidase [Limnofasciculus baicalensis]MCP2731758.1 S8 family serine peptidase [Limnofasciculus baicalensis BBK-W-15]